MITRTQKRYLLTACAILLAAAGVTTLSLARLAQQPPPPKPEHLPKEYRSEVKGLEIESTTVDRERPGGPWLIVVVRNKTPRAVTAYSVNFGNLYQGRDGGLTDDPVAVIEPYGSDRMEISFDNIHSDKPLIVVEAFYDDGTEEGREDARRWRRETRARAKEKGDAKKGEPK